MRRATCVAFACLVLALVWATFPATGNAQGSCVPVSQFIEMAQRQPTYLAHAILEGKERALANEIWNASPPESAVVLPVIVLVTRKDGFGGMFVGSNGHVCNMLLFSKEHWIALLRSIRGPSA